MKVWETNSRIELLTKQFVGRSAALLPWLAEESVTDILINGVDSLFVEREGRLTAEVSPFSDQLSLLDFIERLLIPIGKRIDASHPYIDGRCLDGSRFHIILPPIAHQGPFISIRKWRHFERCSLESFGEPALISWLREQVCRKRNILISGGTGTGKTTLLARLLDCLPSDERIAVLEESLEIRTCHPHVIQLEGRPSSPEGKGEVTLRALIRNSLRMRPDRIVVGECRGEEAFDMLQAMNSGHAGSLTTLHSNGAQDALKKLETLVLLTGYVVPIRAVREWIASSIQVVVYLEREGSVRGIVEVLEINGMEGEVYRVTPKFRRGGKLPK